MTDITPAEKVAVVLAFDDGGIYDEALDGWVTLKADGATVEVKVAHHDDDGEEIAEEAQHFRAVVVEGETVPDPAELERLRAQVESLKARLSSAESVMRQALADPVHETRTHLLGLYLAAAQSAQDGGDDA